MPISLEHFDDPALIESCSRFRARLPRVRTTLDDIARRRQSKLETAERRASFEEREQDLRSSGIVGFQRTIGARDDLLSFEFLEQGMLAGQAVGLVRIDALDAAGTGFLVAPNVLLTNQHVLPSVSTARNARFLLGFEEDSLKVLPASPRATLTLDPDRFFVTDPALDYSFVGVDTGSVTDRVSWLPLIEEQGKIQVGHPVNLIQHPGGRVKHVVLHNSHLLDLENGADDEMFCWYSSDTAKGSSGSPVFNNRWEVVALHHRAIPRTNRHGEVLDLNGRTMTAVRFREQPEQVHWIGNEGTRVSAIVRAFRDAPIDNRFAAMRERLLSLWAGLGARRIGLKIGWQELYWQTNDRSTT